MLDKILSRLRDPYEADTEKASKFFEEKKNEDIKRAEVKATDLRDQIEGSLEDLLTELEKLEEFNDHKDRKVVEDVADNIVSDRKDLVKSFEVVDDPDGLLERLNNFLSDFDSLSRKEAAVAKEANLMEEIRQPMKKLQEQHQELEEFLDTEYSARKKLDKLKKLEENRERIRLDIDEKQFDIDDLEIEEIREETKELERKLEEFKKNEQWQNYIDTEKRLEELKSDRRELENQVGTALSKMERGMKKLVYQIENNQIEFEGDLSVLEKIRDGKTSEIIDKPEKVVEAVEDSTGVLPLDLLDDAVHRKFMDGAEFLMDLPDHHQEFFELSDNIKELNNKIETHDAVKEKEQLERKIEKAGKDLKKAENQYQKLEEEVDELKKELEANENKIKEVLKSGFKREIVFE